MAGSPTSSVKRAANAEREWRRAVDLVDEPADALLGLARALAARGRPGDAEAARQEARRALAADPGHVEARRFLRDGR